MGGKVDCLCAGGRLDNIKANNFKIFAKNAETCRHSRQMHRPFIPDVCLPPLYGDHGCSANEFRSLTGRHLTQTRETEREHLNGYYNILRSLASRIPQVSKLSSRELIRSRPQRMRKRYIKGLMLDLKPTHGNVNLFVKFEKKDDPGKAPRAIQYRATPFTARLAKYIVPIEKAISKVVDGENGGFPFVAKGYNSLERGNILYEMWVSKDNPVAYLIDHSKFDSCVNTDLLKMEHEFYKTLFPNDKNLSYLLNQQLVNKGRTRNGIKYWCKGRRMSGDPNTACGNCVINYAILRHAFGPEALIFVDGDDSVVITNGEQRVDLSGSGMDSKVNIAKEFCKIEFCQCQPVYTPNGWLMCREPMRALNRACYIMGKVPTNLPDYLATIGMGEGMCSPYMPIISVLADKFRSYGGSYKWYFTEYRPNAMNVGIGYKMPTDVSRVSFDSAFEIDAHTQRLIEQKLQGMVLKLHYQH